MDIKTREREIKRLAKEVKMIKEMFENDKECC